MTAPIFELERRVLAADENRYRALYSLDLEALSAMLADDYVHVHASGKIDDKRAFLAAIQAAKYRFVHAERTEQRVRVYESAIFLHGKTRTTLDVSGETKVMDNAFLTAWTNTASGLKLMHWQATRLPDA